MKCDHCETRIEQNKPFSYAGWNFCCECMGVLVSWFLDGGQVTDPEMFAYLEEPAPV